MPIYAPEAADRNNEYPINSVLPFVISNSTAKSLTFLRTGSATTPPCSRITRRHQSVCLSVISPKIQTNPFPLPELGIFSTLSPFRDDKNFNTSSIVEKKCDSPQNSLFSALSSFKIRIEFCLPESMRSCFNSCTENKLSSDTPASSNFFLNAGFHPHGIIFSCEKCEMSVKEIRVLSIANNSFKSDKNFSFSVLSAIILELFGAYQTGKTARSSAIFSAEAGGV